MTEHEALTQRSTISEMVRQYQDAEKDVRDGFALVLRGLRALNEFTSFHRLDFECPEEVAIQLRRKTWRTVVARLQMQKAMSVKAWTEFEKKLENEDPPPVTVELIEGMVRGYRQNLPDMLEESVREVFEWLRPRSSEYKTNTEFEIGKRVILNWVVDIGWSNHWGVHHSREAHLTALENVFDLVAGNVRKDNASHWSDLSLAIKACTKPGPCAGETQYFKFRGHRKGTLHLEFKRLDLVQKLNAIAGGARLKTATPEETH